MLCAILIVPSVVILVSLWVCGVIYRKKAPICTCPSKLDGKTAIVTGSCSGIGKEAAKGLAARGARVILACINPEPAEEARAWIVSETGNRNVVVRQVDVSDLESVRRFAKKILETEKRLDILVNNAGVYVVGRKESKQGLELTMATNYHGPFLLTNLLLGLMRKSFSSRIINVASVAHIRNWTNLEDLHYKTRKYIPFRSYAQSKLCTILFTKELSNIMNGKGVTVNCLHPGLVNTQITAKTGTLLGYLYKRGTQMFGRTAEQGAQTAIHLAVSDKVSEVTGEYFTDCKVAESSKQSHDPGLAKKLWELTEEEVGLKKDERHYLN